MITCRFENGDKVNLRHVVTGAIIVKDNRVLLEKRGKFNGRPIMESGKWAISGGYLDRDEDPNVAMIFIATPSKQEKVNSEEVTELKWFDLGSLPTEEEMAFDHRKELALYKRYLKENFSLPVLGEIGHG